MCNSSAAFRQSGATLLEFAVAVIVVSILAATLFERLLHVQEYVEKVEMELMISNLRSAVRIKVGEYLIADRAAEISTLAGANPVDWLDRRPENYLGSMNDALGADAVGRWYFDTAHRELVYTVKSRRHFLQSEGGDSTSADNTVRVRVQALPNVVGTEGPAWVRAVVSKYQWF